MRKISLDIVNSLLTECGKWAKYSIPKRSSTALPLVSLAIVSFLLVACGANDHGPFVVSTISGKEIFLSMEGWQIEERLGKAKSVKDKGPEYPDTLVYRYDGLEVTKEGGFVSQINISKNNYEIRGGARIGDWLWKADGFNFWILGLIKVLDMRYYEESRQAEFADAETSDLISLYAHDPFGVHLYRNGERKDEGVLIYELDLRHSKGSITGITLRAVKMLYGDL